jgi:hypothetical protein
MGDAQFGPAVAIGLAVLCLGAIWLTIRSGNRDNATTTPVERAVPQRPNIPKPQQPKAPPAQAAPAPPAPPTQPLDGPRMHIVYADVHGEVTARWIKPTQAVLTDSNPQDLSQLLAWCELRQDLRHFRIGRIQALTDPQTGEVLRHMGAIFGWCRLRFCPQLARPDDYHFEGMRELDFALRQRLDLPQCQEAQIAWASRTGKPRRMAVAIAALSLNGAGEVNGCFAAPRSNPDSESLYLLAPRGSTRRLLAATTDSGDVMNDNLRPWLATLPRDIPKDS